MIASNIKRRQRTKRDRNNYRNCVIVREIKIRKPVLFCFVSVMGVDWRDTQAERNNVFNRNVQYLREKKRDFCIYSTVTIIQAGLINLFASKRKRGKKMTFRCASRAKKETSDGPTLYWNFPPLFPYYYHYFCFCWLFVPSAKGQQLIEWIVDSSLSAPVHRRCSDKRLNVFFRYQKGL